MRNEKKFLHKLIELMLITICFSLSLYIPGYAQQSDDSDPQRWVRVKSWTGTFTYSCTDTRTDTQDGGTVTFTWDDHINGNFTLDQLTSQAGIYLWNGKGACSGKVHEETVSTDEEGNSITTTWDGTKPAPLVQSPGYFLKINLTDGTYFFQAETVQMPVKIKECSDEGCTTTDYTYGNGGINSFFQPLPATGFGLKGSYDAALLIGAGTLNATITWDIQAKEIAPASGCPLMNTINSQNQLAVLRSLRDDMITHEAGLMITMLYYQHAPEVAAILKQNLHLQNEVRELANRNIGLIQQLLSEREIVISADVIADIECFIEKLEPYASPQLQDSVVMVLAKIKDASFVRELGLTVF